jgi:hypothetical protein
VRPRPSSTAQPHVDRWLSAWRSPPLSVLLVALLPSPAILLLASLAFSRAGIALLAPESVRLLALLHSPAILLLPSLAFSRAGIALLAPESVRLLALFPSPTILLLATHSLLRATLAELARTATEFLACVTCARLIGVGLLQPSTFPHDH